MVTSFNYNGKRYSADITGALVEASLSREQILDYAIKALAIDNAFRGALVEGGIAKEIGEVKTKGATTKFTLTV